MRISKTTCTFLIILSCFIWGCEQDSESENLIDLLGGNAVGGSEIGGDTMGGSTMGGMTQGGNSMTTIPENHRPVPQECSQERPYPNVSESFNDFECSRHEDCVEDLNGNGELDEGEDQNGNGRLLHFDAHKPHLAI